MTRLEVELEIITGYGHGVHWIVLIKSLGSQLQLRYIIKGCFIEQLIGPFFRQISFFYLLINCILLCLVELD